MPFLDQMQMPWYEDCWSRKRDGVGAPGHWTASNDPQFVGKPDVNVRYKDPCVVSLGEGKGWLMLVARDLVRAEVAERNSYPPAVTSLLNGDTTPCFPDNPGVNWPDDSGASTPFHVPVIGPHSEKLQDVFAPSEYLADIVAFWSESSDFAEVFGPFWVRPSLVTEAAKDETTDGYKSQPRYWYGVPGAVVVEHGEDEPMLYVYFIKDQCFHNHCDRPGSVGVNPLSAGSGALTSSEQLYYTAVGGGTSAGKQKIILRKILVSEIWSRVLSIKKGLETLSPPSAWNEMDDSLDALFAGEESEVLVYDARSGDTRALFTDSEGAGLAGPMPAINSNGKLLLFLVVAQDPKYRRVPRRSYNGIWVAVNSSMDRGAPQGTAFEIGEEANYHLVAATGMSHDEDYYDPDPVFVPSSDTVASPSWSASSSPGTGLDILRSGTWYLYTGHGNPSTISCWTSSASGISP